MNVYTLDTLQNAVAAIKPAKLAVLGKPISHSASPQLHQAALDAESLDFTYIRLEVDEGMLKTAFHSMAALGFRGCNVTVPHKFEAMEACDIISEQAQTFGAVNTVVFTEGKTIGYNTDGPGFEKAIATSFDLKLTNAKILVLGAGGGAGQAIATQCALAKSSELILVNRSLEKIESLAEKLRFISPNTKILTLRLDDSELKYHSLSVDLLVQTTSLGLKATDSKVIGDDFFSSKTCVYDTIYNPAETPFLISAKKAGCPTDNGLSLLIHQGALAFQHWFPSTEPLFPMKRAMQQ